MVRIDSARYAIARRYMNRLGRDDFGDAERLARLAAEAGISVPEFRRQFEYLTEDEPPPYELMETGEAPHEAITGA
jgi:6-phosphofructokinase 1